jgi:hypothetical protein
VGFLLTIVTSIVLGVVVLTLLPPTLETGDGPLNFRIRRAF